MILPKLSALKDVLSDDYLTTVPYPGCDLCCRLQKRSEPCLGFSAVWQARPGRLLLTKRSFLILNHSVDQAAIALRQIPQTERLRAAYQDGIQRFEY